jgi:hypothetical protein
VGLRDDSGPYWESNLGRPARSPSLYPKSYQSSKKQVKVCKNLLLCHVSVITNVTFERQSSVSMKITIFVFVTLFNSERCDFFGRIYCLCFQGLGGSQGRNNQKQLSACFYWFLIWFTVLP